ncbi:MAG: ABC transporter substrate-binding protein [Chloroflexota bacterium]|nr:ABC transporter substrate-binding protein [Chloroflexota bacterium]
MVGSSCTSSSGAIERIHETGVLRVAVDPSFPPFEYIDAANTIQGVDAELAREIAHRLDVEAQLVTTNYDGLYDALTVGRADVIISGLFPDPARTQDFTFSAPYFNAGQVLVTLAASAEREVADLAGKPLAVIFGTTGHMVALQWEETLIPPPTIITYERPVEALVALADGAVMGAVLDNVSAQTALVRGGNYQVLALPANVEPYVIAARRQDAALIKEIDNILLELQEEGLWEALLEKWLQ